LEKGEKRLKFLFRIPLPTASSIPFGLSTEGSRVADGDLVYPTTPNRIPGMLHNQKKSRLGKRRLE
jgi:hypothetical protein